MSDAAIKISDLSKIYRIGRSNSSTFTDLARSLFSRRNTSDSEFWALKDVSFEVNRGDAVAIIGKNGAGKSTLLKILSRITQPSKGRFEISGRVSSLLEVGTGFHQELTGRENIFLNGTILGMKRAEVREKFDEIVEFSGVAKFLDTPVKHYSSGMYVRLAFAVAAHLEPEILIIDEVLAVGDIEFQKKCMGKMKDVTGQGRTVLFVSHNMGAVRNLCSKGIFLQNGQVACSGNVDTVIGKYLSDLEENERPTRKTFFPPKDIPMEIEQVQLLKNSVPAEDTIFDFKDHIGFQILINCKEVVKNRAIVINCYNSFELLFSTFDISLDESMAEERQPGKFLFTVNYPAPVLKAGSYSFDFEVGLMGVGPEQYEKQAIVLDVEVLSKNPRLQAAASNRPGRFYVEPEWDIVKMD